MTDPDTDLLRTRLHSAVPEPPDSVTEARPVVARARQARRRRLTGSVVGAAAAVALVASLGAVLTPDRASSPSAGGDRGVATEPAPDPYGTDPCPASLGLSSRAAVAVSGAVRSVRLCAYTDVAGQAVPLDALVTSPDALVAKAATLPAADPGRCAAVTPMRPPTALVVTGVAGARSVFPVGFCSDVDLAGRSVESERVQRLLLAALEAQRQEVGPPESVSPPTVTDLCAVTGSTAPLDPARDTLVAGAVCLAPGAGRPTVRPFALTADALATVQEAWSTATEVPPDQPQCLALGLRSLALSTEYGDVVRVTDNGCSLVTATDGSGPSYQLDLDRADLVRLPEKIDGDPALP